MTKCLYNFQNENRAEYLKCQLNLFSRMCWGNNAKIIHALSEKGHTFVTFEETLLCSKDSTLKASLRSKYVRLMIGIANLMIAKPVLQV